MPHQFWTGLSIVIMAGCAQIERGAVEVSAPGRDAVAVAQVSAVAETPPVATASDAADDPAIWVNPQDPSKSLVIGTDKQRGLHLYDLNGRLLQTLPDGRMNNVDNRDGFMINGRSMPLVAASNRSDKSIAFYLLDPLTQRLTRVGKPVPTGFGDPYGLCMYVNRDGNYFVFVSEADSGRFRQWRVRADGNGIAAELVREFKVGSQAEGCVADDKTGVLYVAEEDVGLWKYRADADGGNRRHALDRVGSRNGLNADLEGVAIWHGRDGRGFIVMSNQGANRYAVYRREGDNAFVGQFEIVDVLHRGIDGTSETDGLAVTSHPLGLRYPDGLLVVQDGKNQPAGEYQNFKFVSWRDIGHALGIRAEVRVGP